MKSLITIFFIFISGFVMANEAKKADSDVQVSIKKEKTYNDWLNCTIFLKDKSNKPIILTGKKLLKRIKTCFPPIFPDAAKRGNIRGGVLTEIIVDFDGRVISHKILSGHPLLNNSVSDVIYKWRFNPITKRKKAFGFLGRLFFSFSTDSEERKKFPYCLQAHWK